MLLVTFEPPLADVYQPSNAYPARVGAGNVPYVELYVTFPLADDTVPPLPSNETIITTSVGAGVAVGVGVGTRVGADVGDGARVGVGVGVGVRVEVAVGLCVDVGEGISVRVEVGRSVAGTSVIGIVVRGF